MVMCIVQLRGVDFPMSHFFLVEGVEEITLAWLRLLLTKGAVLLFAILKGIRLTCDYSAHSYCPAVSSPCYAIHVRTHIFQFL